MAELSKKFDRIAATPSSDEKSSDDRKSLENISKLESENSDLKNRLEINDKSKNELSRKYTKCLDRIYDLEKELDRANQQVLIKNEQLIGVREAAGRIFAQFSELRSEITSARRAQIDMRRGMQNEVQIVQAHLVALLEDYEISRPPKVADFGSDTLTRLQQVF